MLLTAQQKYQQAQMQTASPAQLVIMLYDGAIRFIKTAIQGVEEKNIEKANQFFGKTQAIVHELIASLDMRYEISKELLPIYDYMLHRLIEANIRKDIVLAEEVLDHLTEMREAWDQIIKGSPVKAGWG